PTTWMIGLVIFAAAIPSALASSSLSNVLIFNQSIFDATDFLVSNIMLPIGSFLIAIFIVRKMDQVLVKEEFHLANGIPSNVYHIWHFLMKWIIPLTIVIVMFNTLGIW